MSREGRSDYAWSIASPYFLYAPMPFVPYALQKAT